MGLLLIPGRVGPCTGMSLLYNHSSTAPFTKIKRCHSTNSIINDVIMQINKKAVTVSISFDIDDTTYIKAKGHIPECTATEELSKLVVILVLQLFTPKFSFN